MVDPRCLWIARSGPRNERHNLAVLQVGATPEGVEVPRCVIDPDCLRTIEQQLPGHRATVPPGADPKWRFFWRLGPRPAHTQFAELNAAPVIPAGKHIHVQVPQHLITPANGFLLHALESLAISHRRCMYSKCPSSEWCDTEPLLAAFPEWREVMDGWGERMLATVSTVSEIVAVGLGLDRDAFTSQMQMGPHLLAPTGAQCSTGSSEHLSNLNSCVRTG